jgi:hypothetical protein
MAETQLCPMTLTRLRPVARRAVLRAVAGRGRLTVVDGLFLVGAIPGEPLATDLRVALTVVALICGSRRITPSFARVQLSELLGRRWSR